MTESRRLLLDTQVYRNLAYGCLPPDQVVALERLAAARPRVLWTCDIVLRELIAHVRPQEAAHFTHFRDAFRWMDRLCGNGGVAAPLHHALWKAAFGETLPWSPAEVVGLNQWRRRLIKADSIEEVAMIAPAESVRAWSLLGKDTWGSLGRRLRAAYKRKPPRSPEQHRAVVVEALVGIVEHLIDEGRRRVALPQGPRPRAGVIETELREFIHLHVKLLSAHSVATYKFGRHATDAMDRWMLAYAGAGYTVVTMDQRLIRTLAEARCPNPRVMGLEEALTGC